MRYQLSWLLIISCIIFPINALSPPQNTQNTQKILQYPISPPKIDPIPVPLHIYQHLYTYAHLLDIAYCIDSLRRINPPFDCELDCKSLFPDLQLVYQWFFDDSVCGYIASSQRGLFNSSNEFLQKNEYPPKDPFLKKLEYLQNDHHTVIISLRGTRSVLDTLTDLKFDMTPYLLPGTHIPMCGSQCKVHAGFHEYYRNTFDVIHPYIVSELKKGGPNTKLVLVGHSLGGAVALLLSLHYLALGVKNLEVVTMGQPLVGNQEFVDWADSVLGSQYSLNEKTANRKWLRVIHRDDMVTTVPRGSFLQRYSQFNNQIYLNASAANAAPRQDQIVDCRSGNNAQCIAGDVLQFRPATDYILSHNTYFRHLGLCGIHVTDDHHTTESELN